jgi:hypothetical protein
VNTTYIYTLSDPRNGAVRYVGKTDTPSRRARTHLKREPGHTHKGKWVQSLLIAGVKPTLEVLDEVPYSEWMFWEQHWVQVLRGWGFDLVNGDNGGLGHFRVTADLARKISATLKGRKLPERWKKVSAYALDGTFVRTFDSVSDAAKATGTSTANLVTGIQKNRAAGGFLWRYEASPKIDSPYVDGKIPISEKHRMAAALVSRQRKGKPLTPEHRQKMAKSARKRWESIESREKAAEATRRWFAEHRRPSKAEAFRALLVAELAKQPGVLGVELLRRARLAGYAGCKSALYELIAAIRPRERAGPRCSTPRAASGNS